MRSLSVLSRLGALGLGLLGLAGLGLAGGCSDNSAPNTFDSYGWKIVVPNAGGGRDSVAFHWTRSALPMKVWVEDQLGAPALARAALDRWSSTIGSGAFSGTVIADSTQADVIIRVAAPPPGGGAALHRLHASARPCQGAVDIVPVGETRTLTLPMRLYVFTGFDPADAGVADCLDATMTHEMGHALGLFVHSLDSNDVMFAQPVVARPSYRDRATAQLLYQGPSDLAPARP